MSRYELLCSLAQIISDYREGEEGEISRPSPEHVEAWVKQFPEHNQEPILNEMNYVLSKAYFKRESVIRFIKELITNQKLSGQNPEQFWATVNFLNIQQGGSSQNDMLELFDNALQTHLGYKLSICGSQTGPFVYLDDVIFSGNRVRYDIEKWINDLAPSSCTIHVIVIAFHRGGQWYASTRLRDAAKRAGKTVDIRWWRCVELEDRKSYISKSDVLRPTVFPEDKDVQEYVKMLSDAGYPPERRQVTDPPYQSLLFSSESGRQLLEQSFLAAGVLIRKLCPYLPEQIRPLGYSVLKTFGFGSVIVTFRNCPNTCPPALWAGDPWYHLFPRKTN